MRRLWIDAQFGASGDMLLAALLDAGADLHAVREGLRGLVPGRWSITPSEVRRGAFRALRAEVRVGGRDPDADFSARGLVSAVPLGPAERGFGVRGPNAAHTHGSWAEIRARFEDSALPPRAKQRALLVYGRLAAAEARLHGVAIDAVHLHEVGSADAVLDIAGCCLALESLGIDEVFASAVPLGTGTIRAAHGDLPLPAPATLAVLEGWPVFPTATPGEWVTPTGAALITGLAQSGPPPAGIVRATGHGAGRHDPSTHANLLRAVVLESDTVTRDAVIELACNLDDQASVTLAAVPELLFAAGALDVWFAPVQMKKGRPGVVLHALVPPPRADAVTDLILRHTAALGVRKAAWSRTILDRWWEEVATPWGPVRIKVGGRDATAWHAVPETDDVLAISRRTGVPAIEVTRVALAAWRPQPEPR